MSSTPLGAVCQTQVAGRRCQVPAAAPAEGWSAAPRHRWSARPAGTRAAPVRRDANQSYGSGTAWVPQGSQARAAQIAGQDCAHQSLRTGCPLASDAFCVAFRADALQGAIDRMWRWCRGSGAAVLPDRRSGKSCHPSAVSGRPCPSRGLGLPRVGQVRTFGEHPSGAAQTDGVVNLTHGGADSITL